MGTVVRIEVVGANDDETQRDVRQHGVDAAFDWFRQVEACCSRFDPRSALRQLTASAGTAVAAPQMLFELVRFALALAQETNGAFDPTVGVRMEAARVRSRVHHGPRRANGDRRERSGELSRRRTSTSMSKPSHCVGRSCSTSARSRKGSRSTWPYASSPRSRTSRSMPAGISILLGATPPVSHGRSAFVIHATSISSSTRCVSRIPRSAHPATTSVESRATHRASIAIQTITSSTRERACPRRQRRSVTVVAPLAIVADGLATAAFVLGPALGIELLERHGVSGMIVTPSLERFVTRDA